MTLFQQQFGIFSDTWKDGYGAEVKRTSAAFFLLILLGFGVCAAPPDLRSTLVEDIMDLFGTMDITNEAGELSAPALLSNNLRACMFSMLCGLIPFIQLPALLLAFAMGLYICGQMTRRVRHDETALPVWECLSRISWLMLLVLALLLAVAAVLEAHISRRYCFHF